MTKLFKDVLSNAELSTLSSIVHIGDATYRELMENQRPMFGHPYFSDTRGRIRTKLVQIQCEIESHDSNFPFNFYQREFSYKQRIPELRTKNIIIHIGRSLAPNRLTYRSKYKIDLSYNNEQLRRQQIIDFDKTPPFGEEPFYGILVFGGHEHTFSVLQFPEPGYKSIADSILIPQIIALPKSEEAETFERKKALLKKEFFAHESKEAKS